LFFDNLVEDENVARCNAAGAAVTDGVTAAQGDADAARAFGAADEKIFRSLRNRGLDEKQEAEKGWAWHDVIFLLLRRARPPISPAASPRMREAG
jgi:hypothetical protein